MNFIIELINKLTKQQNINVTIEENLQPTLVVNKKDVVTFMQLLKNNEKLFFDYLECITGVDYGPKKNKMEIVYHLQSIPYGYFIAVKTPIIRNELKNGLPWTYSITPVYKGANWHEREIYDLYGILFIGHPNLKKIFMPEDWIGFPMRKDYIQQPTYKGINCLKESPINEE